MKVSTDLHHRYLNLAGPNILSNLLVPLASLVDTALLGHLSEIEMLGGVALGAVLFDYVFWTFGFLRMSTTGLVAQSRGRGNLAEESRIGMRALAIALLAGTIIVLLRGPLGDLGFALFGGDAATEAAGRQYYEWRVLGAPFALMNFALLGWLLGREQGRAALLMAAAGQCTNIVLDLIFIRSFHWAAAGAGGATAISQVVMFLVAITLFWRDGIDLSGAKWAREFRAIFHGPELRAFFTLSGDITLRTMLLVSTFALFTNIAATMGEIALAATAVLRGVILLVAYFVDGFAFATESLAGVFHGPDHLGERRRLLLLSLLWGSSTAAAALTIFLLFPRTLLGLLTDHREVLDLAIAHRGWLVPVLLWSAPAYVLDGYYLGLSRGGLLRRAMTWSVLLGFAPWALWSWHTGSLPLLWAALSVFMLARSASLGWPALRELRD